MNNPQTPRKPSKSRRKHIPVLAPDALELVLRDLAALPISKAAKAQVAEMLRAAANPDNDKVDVIIRTMSKQEQSNIEKTTQAIDSVMGSVMARGRQGLLDIDDDEWQRLVDEANSEG